jgi:hypothetical protein
VQEDETRSRQIVWQWLAIGARNGLVLGVIACAMSWTPVLIQGLPARNRLFEMIQDSMWVIAGFVVSAALIGLVIGRSRKRGKPGV